MPPTHAGGGDLERAHLPGADELFRPTRQRAALEAPAGVDPAEVDIGLLEDMLDTVAEASRHPLPASESVPLPIAGLLAWTAASIGAKHAVEIGAHAGATGLCLLQGLDPRGVVTSITRDTADHQAATDAFASAGVTDRVRSMAGDPSELLGRLSDATYDLVLIGDIGTDQRELRSHALRLLRPGGALIALGIARAGEREELRARRSFVRELADDERLTVVVLPLHHGVVLARTKTPDA